MFIPPGNILTKQEPTLVLLSDLIPELQWNELLGIQFLLLCLTSLEMSPASLSSNKDK